jgi:putative ABC transport system permease protein
MADLWKDLRYTLRTWRKSPGFTLVVLLTVALSVGATTAIFSVVNGVLLKPLPYPDPDRVVFLWSSNPSAGLPIFSVSPHDFVDWKRQSTSFEFLSARRLASFNLTGDGAEPERIPAERVSEEYFAALGLKAIHGRLLLPEEQIGGGARVAVLNRNLWERRFGGDPELVGKPLLLDGEPYTVVGIVDDPLRGTVAEMWTPLGLDLSKEDRGFHIVFVIGRLKEGVSLEKAQAEMGTIAKRLQQQYPDTNEGWEIGLDRMHNMIVKDVRPRLMILLAAVVAVLLIACANLMNLFLARFATREREMALRTALGARRGRVARQLLTEILLVAIVGSAVGVVLATWGTKALLALNTKAVPRPGEVGVDGRVLLFALGVALLTGLAAGLWPALRASRPNLQAPLKDGSRTMTGGMKGKMVRNALVLTEVAAALVLLIAAGLLIKSFARLNDIDPGFRPSGGLTARVYLPAGKYTEPAQQSAAWNVLLERVRALPDVEAAGLISRMPLAEHRVMKGGAWPAEKPPTTEEETPVVNLRTVSIDTFRALGIPVLQGRPFQPQDATGGAPSAVINRALAERLWPGQSQVVGRQMTWEMGTSGPMPTTVIGVVGNLRNNSIETEGDLEVYLPSAQTPVGEATLVVRTASGDPSRLAMPLRGAVSSFDPELPISNIATLQEIVDQALSPARFAMLLLVLFAGLALILASVGVYGVISYSVAQRTHEIGIRMAMGADRGDVLRMVLRQSLVIALIGVAVGLACAAGLTRFLAGQLYGVSATDPAIFLAVAALLTAVAAVASWVPARRATGVDPLMAMR